MDRPRNFEDILSRLPGAKQRGDSWIAPCPLPGHKTPAGHLTLKDAGDKALITCQGGRHTYQDYCEAWGFDSLMYSCNGNGGDAKILATYDYTDADGKLLYQVVRFKPKSFKQRRPDGAGGWVWDRAGITPTLYHLPEVLQAINDHKLIWIVEGEKDVDNLTKVGIPATTISGGASTRWPPSLVPRFLAATVAIIPDDDEPGRKYAQYVANLLYGWCSSLKIITLPVGKDVSDYLETQAIDNLLNIAYNTGEYIPSGVVTREEFNELRGLNLYLLRTLCNIKRKTNNRYVFNTIKGDDGNDS